MQQLLSEAYPLVQGGVEFNAYVQSGALLGFCAGAIWGLQGPMTVAAFVFKPFEITFYGLMGAGAGAGIGAGIGLCAQLAGPAASLGWIYLPPMPSISTFLMLIP